jgi:hypothetical protein
MGEKHCGCRKGQFGKQTIHHALLCCVARRAREACFAEQAVPPSPVFMPGKSSVFLNCLGEINHVPATLGLKDCQFTVMHKRLSGGNRRGIS